MVLVYVGLGGNTDRTPEAFSRARAILSDEFGTIEPSSSLKTRPWKVQTERSFLNQVVEITDPDLEPEELMKRLLDIESDLGRDRANEPDRVIDLDLLYYGGTIRRTERLRLPHPRIHRRPFVLKSMVELNPHFLHPILMKTQAELLGAIRKENNES